MKNFLVSLWLAASSFSTAQENRNSNSEAGVQSKVATVDKYLGEQRAKGEATYLKFTSDALIAALGVADAEVKPLFSVSATLNEHLYKSLFYRGLEQPMPEKFRRELSEVVAKSSESVPTGKQKEYLHELAETILGQDTKLRDAVSPKTGQLPK